MRLLVEGPQRPLSRMHATGSSWPLKSAARASGHQLHEASCFFFSGVLTCPCTTALAAALNTRPEAVRNGSCDDLPSTVETRLVRTTEGGQKLSDRDLHLASGLVSSPVVVSCSLHASFTRSFTSSCVAVCYFLFDPTLLVGPNSIASASLESPRRAFLLFSVAHCCA